MIGDLCKFCKEKIDVVSNIKYTCKKCIKKNGLDKYKKSMIEKYGVENPTQNKTIKDKTLKTNLQRYGCENPMQNEIIKNKTRQTVLHKRPRTY